MKHTIAEDHCHPWRCTCSKSNHIRFRSSVTKVNEYLTVCTNAPRSTCTLEAKASKVLTHTGWPKINRPLLIFVTNSIPNTF